MLRVKVTKPNDVTFLVTADFTTQAAADAYIASSKSMWGKDARWVKDKDLKANHEDRDLSDASREYLVNGEFAGFEFFFPADYAVEIMDVTSEYNERDRMGRASVQERMDLGKEVLSEIELFFERRSIEPDIAQLEDLLLRGDIVHSIALIEAADFLFDDEKEKIMSLISDSGLVPVY